MYLINVGTMYVEEKYKEEFIKAVKDSDIIFDFNETEVYSDKNGNVCVELQNESSLGDIENDLSELTENLFNQGIILNGEIQYYGDYEGRYEITNGIFEAFSNEECVIRDSPDSVLINELRRRHPSLIIQLDN